MISTDYTGRQVDLSIFPGNTIANLPANSGFTAIDSKAIAGPLALAQAVSVALLTPLGHYKSDPLFGSTLIQGLQERKIEYPTDILHNFALAAVDVIQYFDQQRPDVPDDEKIATLVLDSYNVSGTTIELSISMTTQAGPSLTFLLPVQWRL